MRLGFMNRLRNGYGNIYTPHAGSMIIQVQRETGLANRTIILSQRQVAFLRIVGSRIGLAIGAVFIATWLLFAVQSVRVPVLSVRIAKLERDNRRRSSEHFHGTTLLVAPARSTIGTKACSRCFPCPAHLG